MFRRIMLLVVLLSLVVGVYSLPSDSMTSPSFIRSDDQDGCTILDLKMKWNLVSFPVEGVDLPKDITPYSLEDGMYRKVEIPLPGRGYWVYSVKPRKIEVCGSPVDRVEWYLSEGKHLLGGPYSEVSVDEVRKILDTQVGEGRYKLEVYEYSQGKYQPTKVIRPFVGYLVKYEGPETKVVLGGKEGVCDHTLTFSDRIKERVVDGLEIDYLGMTKDGRFRFVVYDKSAGKKMFNLTEGERFTYVSHKRVGKEKTSPAVKYTFSLLDVGNVSQGSSQPTIPGAISRPVRPVGSSSSEVSLCADEMNVTCIYDCTDITEPGDYVLCSDIIASSLTNSSGGCINILSSRVNLDGMGHSIRGGTGFVDGIRVSGYSYVNIQNITISGFARDGIFLYSVDHNVVSNCSIYNNSNIGLSFSGSNNLLIGNNLYSNFGGGLSESMSSFNNTIINNNISFNNIHGLFLDGFNDKVFSNRIISNSGSGIYLYISARFNIIANNTVFNNSENGISVTYTGDAVNNTFMNNYVCFNNLSDIFDTSRRNVYINTTYDTSEPDDPDYFDKIGSCAAECPEGYTSVDVGERLFLGSFDGHDYYFYRSSESGYQILEDDSVVFDSSTSSEGDDGIFYGLPNDRFMGVSILNDAMSGYCVLGINGSFSHVESGDVFVPPTTTLPLGMYVSNLLINDVIDNRLGNRVEDSMSWDDRLTNSSPLTLGTLGSSSYVFHLYQYQPPTDITFPVREGTATRLTHRETQDIILYGTTPITTIDSDVATRIRYFGYRIKFGDTVDEESFPSGLNYYGLPVCDRDEDGDWSYCVREGTEDYDHSIVSQRVVIGFLGDDWVITGMRPPEGTAPENDVRRTRGGEISLGHEAAHSFLDVGDSITYHNLRIVLDDVSGDRFAILSIYDSDTDLLLKQVRVSEGDTFHVLLDDVLPTCHNPVIIYVWQAAPGYSSVEWAEVSVFDKEIELVDGSTIELTDPYTGRRWTPQVLLFWKNYNATGSTWDALREIVLLDDTPHEQHIGDNISFPWGEVRYTGLTDSERYELSFRIVDGFTDCDGVYHSPALEIRSTYPEGGLGFVRFSTRPLVNETMWVDHVYSPLSGSGLYIYNSSVGCYQNMYTDGWSGFLYRPYYPEVIRPYSVPSLDFVSPVAPILFYSSGGHDEIDLWEDAGPGGDQRRNINILQFKIVNDSSGYRFTGPSSDDGPDYLYGIRAPSFICSLFMSIDEDGWVPPGDVLWYGVCKNMTLHESGYTERGTAITEFSPDEVRLSIPENITQVILQVIPQPYFVHDTYPTISCPDGYQPVTLCNPLALPDGNILSYGGFRPSGEGELILNMSAGSSVSWTGVPGDVWSQPSYDIVVGSVEENGVCVRIESTSGATCTESHLYYDEIGQSAYISSDHHVELEFMDVDLLKDTDCKPFAIFRVTDYDSEEEYLLKIKEGETDSITIRGTTYYIHVDDINLTSLPGSTTCNVSIYCEGDGAPDTTVNGYERGYSLIRMYDSICSGHHCVDVSGFNYEYRDGHPVTYVILFDEYSWVSRKVHPGEVVSFGPDLNISLYDVYLPLFSTSGMAFAKLVDEPGTTNPWEDYDLVMHFGIGPILDRDGEEWNFLVAGISQDGCERDTLCNYVLLDVNMRNPSSSYWSYLTSVKMKENSSVFLSPCDGCPIFNVSVGGIGYDISLGVQFVYLNVEPTDQPPNYPCSDYPLYLQGEEIPSPYPEYTIRVGNLPTYMYDGPHGGWNVPAVFDVLNESGDVVRVIKVYPGHPVVWNSPHGPIRFDVCEVGNNLYVRMWWVRARVDDGSEGEPYCEDYDLVLGGDTITLDTGEYTFSDIHQNWFGGQLGCWYEPSAHLTSDRGDMYLPESDDDVCDMDVGTLSGYYYMYYRSGEPTGPEAVRCDLVPWYMTVEEGDFTEFDVVCYDEDDNVVDCPDGLLVVTSPPHSVVTSPSGGYLFLAGDVTGLANVIASYLPAGSGAGEGFSCAGQVNVTESHPTCLPLYIKLYDGWNLISFPVIPDDLTLSDILTDHVYEPGTHTVDPGCVDRVVDPSGESHPEVYRFDPSTETFVLCDDETPQPGVGYVVHADHSCVIGLDSGDSVNADGLYSGLPSGWNLIGGGCYNNQPMSTSIPDITDCFRLTSSGDWVPCSTETVPAPGIGYLIRKR